MTDFLELKGVSKQFPGFRLDNISLSLPKGYIMGLVGQNGAGKTTTIKLILNMLEKDTGEILGRYVFVFLNYFVSFLLIIVLHFGFAWYRNTAVGAIDILLGFSLSFFAFSVITGVQMPMFFKMGYTKARAWSLIPFSAVMLMLVIPAFVPALSGLAGFMESHTNALVVGGILASCVIQFVSYHISVVLYRKRK